MGQWLVLKDQDSALNIIDVEPLSENTGVPFSYLLTVEYWGDIIK